MQRVRKLNLPPDSEPVLYHQELARQLGSLEVWSPGIRQAPFGLECSATPDGFQELLTGMQPGGQVVLSDSN